MLSGLLQDSSPLSLSLVFCPATLQVFHHARQHAVFLDLDILGLAHEVSKIRRQLRRGDVNFSLLLLSRRFCPIFDAAYGG